MRSLLTCLVLAASLPFAAQATGETETDDIVRLPGQILAKADQPSASAPLAELKEKGQKLVPGGILILSFDADADGSVSPQELSDGIAAAFASADTNEDGQLTALEQQAWAASLPVRDETLSNPVRFDPNLDRIVTFEEFNSVIRQLAATYQDANGNIPTASLVVPDKAAKDDKRLAQRGARPVDPLTPDAQR